MPQLNMPECQVWDIVSYLATESTTGQAPFKVDIPPQCQVTASASTEATAEATAATGAEATAEATSTNPTGEQAIDQIGGAPVASPVVPTGEVTAESTPEPTAAPVTIVPDATSAGSGS